MEEREGGFGAGRFLVVAGIFIFFLLACAVADELLPTTNFTDAVEQVPGGNEALSGNADAMLTVISDNPGIIDGNDEVDAFTEEEVLRVLEAVGEYNREAAKGAAVSYEYVHYEGKVESFDPVTGAATVTSWKEVRTGTQEVGRHQELVGTERVMVEYTQEELNAMAAALGGSSFTPPPAWFDRPVYEEVIDYEQVETEIVHQPVIETRTDSVTLSRQGADPNGELLGENVYELDWRPVLVLCSMMAKSRDYGDGTVLLDEEIDAAINFFGYQYSFIDDASAEEGWSGSLDRFETRNAAYELSVSGNPVVGEVCSFDVRKVPKVAPKLIANAYLSYEYEYADETEGAKRLIARTLSIDGESFSAGCAELCDGEFDAEVFAELLSTLPGTEGSYEHFTMLAGGINATERTEDPSECPCIGTLVSSVSGWEVRHAERFFAGIVGISTDGGAAPQGARVVSAVSWTPSQQALSNETFKAVWEAASSCIGTPYVFGGNKGPGLSFDCSSYVSWVLRNSGHPKVGRLTTTGLLGSSTGITDAGYVTAISSPEPGDLIFFKGTIKDRNKSHVSHVAIYLGEGMMIHASGSAGCVTVAEFEGSDLKRNHFMCYGRVRSDK